MNKTVTVDLSDSSLLYIKKIKENKKKNYKVVLTDFIESDLYKSSEDSLFEFLNNPPKELSAAHYNYILMLKAMLKREVVDTSEKSKGRPSVMPKEIMFNWALIIDLGSVTKASRAIGKRTKEIWTGINRLDDLGSLELGGHKFSFFKSAKSVKQSPLILKFYAASLVSEFEMEIQGIEHSNELEENPLSRLRHTFNEEQNVKALDEYKSKYRVVYNLFIKQSKE